MNILPYICIYKEICKSLVINIHEKEISKMQNLKKGIFISLFVITMMTLGCTTQYIIPDADCPKTIYLIEPFDEDFEPITVKGILKRNSEIFDNPESEGYGILMSDSYYHIMESWNDPKKEPSLKDEDRKRLEKLIGKYVRLSGYGYFSEEIRYGSIAIEKCN